MFSYQLIGVLAGIFSAVAFIPYIYSILRGRTKPSRVTWFVWTLVGVLICGSYKSVGATDSAWITYTYIIGPLAVFILSLRYGVRGWGLLDVLCLNGALLGGLMWLIFDSPLIALTMNIAMDFFGLVPTLKKAWIKPKEEDRYAWSITAASGFLNLFALEIWNFSLGFYPVYVFLATLSVCLTLWWKHFTSHHREVN